MRRYDRKSKIGRLDTAVGYRALRYRIYYWMATKET